MSTAVDQTKAGNYQPRLKVEYFQKIQQQLVEELKLGNIYQAPKLHKIIVGVGLGRAKDDKVLLQTATNTLTKITGQKTSSNPC